MLCSDNPDLQNEKSEALLLFIHLFFGFVLGSFLIYLTCSSSLCCKLKETVRHSTAIFSTSFA